MLVQEQLYSKTRFGLLFRLKYEHVDYDFMDYKGQSSLH
jgi:hypothetical protein